MRILYRSLCRNPEIQMDSVEVLSFYLREGECRTVFSAAPELPLFLLDGHRHSREAADHRTTRYSIPYHAANFLFVMDSLCASSDAAVARLVQSGLLLQLHQSLRGDTYKFGHEVFYATSCLLHVLNAENGKYREAVNDLPSIKEGTLFRNFHFWLNFLRA